MEKMRIAHNLRKQLETEYDMNNGYELAEKLANAGYTELNDELRSKILFLKQICKEVRADNFYVISLLADCSLDDIRERYLQYVKYTGETKSNPEQLRFSSDGAASYVTALHEMGIVDKLVDSIMKSIIKLGCIAKSVDAMKTIINDLDFFEQPIDIRNQFICENAEILFNDYSREAEQVFQTLCQKYGKENGFLYLKEHPEYIRLGIKAMQ